MNDQTKTRRRVWHNFVFNNSLERVSSFSTRLCHSRQLFSTQHTLHSANAYTSWNLQRSI